MKARTVVGTVILAVGLLLTIRVAQLGLGSWQLVDETDLWHERCYVGMIIFPAIAVVGAGIGFGWRFMALTAAALVAFSTGVMLAFGRIELPWLLPF